MKLPISSTASRTFGFFCLLFSFTLPTTLAARQSVADDYRVGAGDLLHITVFGYPDLTGDVRVSQSGNVTFPLIGAVAVADLTPREVETSLSDKLASGHFIKQSQVTVLVMEYQSQRVAVMGEVAKPGQYPLVGTRHVMNMLADAGGILLATAGDQAVVIRADGTRVPIDVVAMMNGDMAQNPVVHADDTINVPKAPQFYIYGEVQKPGVYRLDRGMTVDAAISAGGGLTRRGTERRILAKRHASDGKEYRVSLRGSEPVLPDDVLIVRASWF